MALPIGRVTLADLEIMARTIYGEASGEGRQGKIAVAWVIRHRWQSPRWPESIAEVCQQPNQFSPWNSTDPQRAKIVSVWFDDLQFAASFAIAAAVALQGPHGYPDPTDGATHFHATSIDLPSWTDGLTSTGAIGNHVFYRHAK